MYEFQISRLLILLTFLFSSNCLKDATDQMGMGVFTGAFLSNSEKVNLSELPHEVLALNVYSPNCPPCVRELPTLHRIQERFSKDPRFGIYIVVDPIQVSESVEGDFGSSDPVIRAQAIMKQEILTQKIKIPVIFLDSPFRIEPGSFVTGTPETIMVRTKPWNIFYNFIGSISEKRTDVEIDSDSKVRFFFNTIGARNL
ncbi:hypothetical protein [Leptospira sp. GIMC2001]|uniref:hypothetical protein n=1 Tax=Leptospira sp. GIMC2001 TaxID=1513297 RepID=UPI00234B137E|nr:hypothetical protein [Leptospira sp. GIMC2001]WCL49943.1 hypothetical protein O4O04_03745 [Leptospira sp. GIMC2001]